MFSHGASKLVRLGEVYNKVFLRTFCMRKQLRNEFALLQLHPKSAIKTVSRLNSNKIDGKPGDENEINYAAIVNGDAELEHKLKVIALETEVMRQEGRPVPSSEYMKERHWEELLKLATRTARRKYLEYLFKLSKKKENIVAKKEQKRADYEELRAGKVVEENCSIEDFATKYDLQHNNLFLRIYDSTINQMYNNRLVQAMQFGQKLVIDCGYDANMSKRENINAAKQLMLVFAENRFHDDPFDLHYCNSDLNGTLMTYLEKHIPTMHEKSFPLNIHQCSYLDLFPKNQLVYLTPHCREEITEYDHDTIFIIGGIVDKINNEPLSLAKAKREGIKMAKLPLDKYLQWGSGSGKSLTLNQVTAILLDVKVTGDWNHAMRHVPRRKIVDFGMASNLNQTGALRYDKPRREPKWTPTSKVDFGNLSYNNSNRRSESTETAKSRRIKIQSIFNE